MTRTSRSLREPSQGRAQGPFLTDPAPRPDRDQNRLRPAPDHVHVRARDTASTVERDVVAAREDARADERSDPEVDRARDRTSDPDHDPAMTVVVLTDDALVDTRDPLVADHEATRAVTAEAALRRLITAELTRVLAESWAYLG